MSPEAAQAVREAIELLGRASQDWRNGTADVPGALHWPVAVNLARQELRHALEVLSRQEKPKDRPADALMGMAWYNGLTRQERLQWHERAGSAVPADAWEAYKTGGPQP